MSEPMTCPKCGAGVREEHFSYRRFECMTLELDELGLIGAELRESADCLRRQLAKRDERNAALEARNKELEGERAKLLDDKFTLCAYCGAGFVNTEDADAGQQVGDHIATCPEHPMRVPERERDQLRADLATVAPVVRAAMDHEEAVTAYQAGKATLRDVARTADAVAQAIRALTPEVRKRIEELEEAGQAKSCERCTDGKCVAAWGCFCSCHRR